MINHINDLLTFSFLIFVLLYFPPEDFLYSSHALFPKESLLSNPSFSTWLLLHSPLHHWFKEVWLWPVEGKLPSGRTDKTLFRMKCICGAEVTEVKEIRWEMLPVMTWGIRRIQIMAFTSWCVCMSKRIKSKH